MYTLITDDTGRHVIRRADGSWVYTLEPKDTAFAEEILARLLAADS